MADRDLQLKQAVEDALQGEKDFSGYDINVRVVQGIVTLYGVVDTLADKEHATRVVSSVAGVRKVENDLTICTDGAVDDRDVYREVRQELDGDPRLKDAMIKITVNNGRVSLGGEVESALVKEAAIATARKAMGVKEIIDNITVIAGNRSDDASLVNEVSRGLSTAGIEQNLLEVDCHNGIISLRGNVDEETKEKAVRLAAGVPGVKKVKADKLETGYRMPTEAARAALRIKRSFAADKSLAGLPLNIYEEEGRLVLEGVLANQRQKRAVDKKLHALMEEFGEEFITVNNKIRLRD